MRTALKTTLAAAAVGALALGLGPSLAYGDRGSPAAGGYGTGRASVVGTSLTVIGLTRDGQRLTRFDTAFPAYTRGRTTVKRLQTDVRLIGIDYRVQDGSCTASATPAASTRSTRSTGERHAGRSG